MSVRVLVPLAEGFEEIEAITVIDVLRRAGAEVVVAGLAAGPVKAAHGVLLQPDTTMEAALGGPGFDAVVLPGGMPGSSNLAADARVQRALGRAREEGRWIGAICAAPAVVLQSLGYLDGKQATCYPSFAAQLPAYNSARVVADGKIVTSQGPGTALEFALELVTRLFGRQKTDEVAGAMVVQGFSR
ncbi:MAG: DJ-1/PfpI family protein [Candidatus Wallbacteria bacterium]|nr:DJ-1/PfpI family protein [Candidatus Wallbacteria bacterium]